VLKKPTSSVFQGYSTHFIFFHFILILFFGGEMAERPKAPDSKSGLRATVTGVQIPLSPPSSKMGSGQMGKWKLKKLAARTANAESRPIADEP
jgi:hypothetical protein